MSGNRAGTEDWFATLQENLRVVPTGCSFWGLYPVLFGTMLRPNPAFVQKKVAIEVGSAKRPLYSINVPMAKAMQVLDGPDIFAMGVHIRAGDTVIRGEANLDQDPGQCEWMDPDHDYMPRAGCIDRLANSHEKASRSKRVLVVFSDSRCVKKHIMDYFADSETFTEV